MSDVPREQIVGARLENNLDDVMERGPRLSWNRSTWIVARDPERQKVLMGGLGAMGVGEMWFPEKLDETVHADGSRTPPDSEDPTYATAPIRSSIGGFGAG